MAEPIPVILNATAGPDQPDQVETITALFHAAGAEVRVLAAGQGSEIAQLARRAAEQRPPVIVVGGGDGTVNCVASVVVGTESALGVLPLGTLNHFAKDLNIPLALPEAVQTIVAGHVQRVDVGEVNGQIFLNNSSLGLYPHMVRHRDILRRRLGAGKWPAAFWAAFTVARRRPFLSVSLREADGERRYRTPLVFVGNNVYAIDGFNLGGRERLDAGELSLYVVSRPNRWAVLTLGARALFGRMRQARDFETRTAQELAVETRGTHIAVATDGEVRDTATPLHYKIRRGALRVIVPAPVVGEGPS